MNDRCQVFQTLPYIGVSMVDLQDCHEAASKLSEKEKIEFYSSKGIDYHKVVKYYDIVCRLNASMNPAKGIGLNHLWESIQNRFKQI